MHSRKADFNLPFAYIILLYIFITFLTPNLQALDSNAPKFFSLAILNFIVFVYLISNKNKTLNQKISSSIYDNLIGLTYFLFVLIALLSFTKSINITESILTFAKLITPFFAALNIATIINQDKRQLTTLSLGMTMLLLLDSFQLIYHVNQYIHQKISSILDINGGYSHKNIFSAAIFIKLPFALWLITYNKGWKKILGFTSLLLAFVSIFFLSSRTFYLGMILLVIVFALFISIDYIITKDRRQLVLLTQFAGIFLLSYLMFTGTQKYLYPHRDSGFDIYNTNVVARIETIKTEPGGERLESWKRSVNLIERQPLLGVGIGNWKIQTLKDANLTNPKFVYHIKNHNDFLELTAETGIIGGLLYILIFVLIILSFLKSFFNKKENKEFISSLFIPAFGVFCYSIDAFFNFPSDRPEIAFLFAVFVAIAIAYSDRKTNNRLSFLKKTIYPKTILLFMLLLLSFGMVVLFYNFKSSKIQRIVIDDFEKLKYSKPSSYFIKNFPSIPNISCVGEPIIVNIVRYLMNEKKYEEGIQLLMKNNPSPYDTRREFYLAFNYSLLGNLDSAYYYCEKVYAQKPLFYNNVELMCDIVQKEGKQKEELDLLNKFISGEKTTTQAWLRISDRYYKAGDSATAISLMDTASHYLPSDTLITHQKDYLHLEQKTHEFGGLYLKAMSYYTSKDYKEAIKYFTEFIDRDSTFHEALEFRAFCYAFINEPAKSNEDMNKLLRLGGNQSLFYNLRGANFHKLGNDSAACEDFYKAMEMKNADGKNNYERFCRKN